jgi:Na+/proline symporter
LQLTWIDWAVVAAYIAINLGIGLYFRKRAGSSTGEFFLSGRNVPWWLAGTSMVATTFAADTPLAVTGMTARNGIAGNWLWWSMLMSGMMTVFFFARLWRRAEVVTDNELVELRYSGRPAAVLRGFRALYLGIAMNCIILGWVNLAMVKILMLTMGLSKTSAMLICLILIGGYTAYYTTISGLWGVLVTDLFQFVLKWGMTIVLAVFAVKAVGGIAAMKGRLLEIDAERAAAAHGSGHILSFIPDIGSLWMPMLAFCVYIGVNWWASWYPGAEPGGGGYIAQRIFCAKDEKNSLLATLWFNVAHYALRPWPWILVALAAVILYPALMAKDPEVGYIQVLMDHLPWSLRGVMLAAFGAAYMSTVGTQLNWGSSYIINDFYRRFVAPGRGDKHYVAASKIATMLLMVISAVVTSRLTSIQGAWEVLIATGAGTGTVYLLRWYWWRINAWSEISAMVTAFITSVVLHNWVTFTGTEAMVFAERTLITVGITTTVWLIATFVTPAEPKELLVAFYRHVRPTCTGWKPIARLAPELAPVHDGWYNLADWIAGCALVYCGLFGIGKLVLGFGSEAVVFLAVGAAAGFYIYWDFSRRGWTALAGSQAAASDE